MRGVFTHLHGLEPSVEVEPVAPEMYPNNSGSGKEASRAVIARGGVGWGFSRALGPCQTFTGKIN